MKQATLKETSSNRVKGDYGELYISNELIMEGYECYSNMKQDTIDLICIKNKIKHNIQVKTATSTIIKKNDNMYSFPIGDEKYRSHIDFFAFVAIENGGKLNCLSYWFVPREFFNGYHRDKICITIPNGKLTYQLKKYENKIVIL